MDILNKRKIRGENTCISTWVFSHHQKHAGYENDHCCGSCIYKHATNMHANIHICMHERRTYICGYMHLCVRVCLCVCAGAFVGACV